MNTKMKKALLVSNILLLLAICLVSVKMINGRASEMAVNRMVVICNHVIDQMDTGKMDLTAAKDYVTQETSHGDYSPNIEVFESGEGLLFETDDPILVNNLLSGSASKVARINCTKLTKR